jgi:hypothetical protein
VPTVRAARRDGGVRINIICVDMDVAAPLCAAPGWTAVLLAVLWTAPALLWMLRHHVTRDAEFKGSLTPSVSPPTSEMDDILGVHVPSLIAALDSAADARDVLMQLYKGSTFLQPCVRHGQKCGKMAIISYRCERVATDPFTLDAFALISAVREARVHGVEFIWLECATHHTLPSLCRHAQSICAATHHARKHARRTLCRHARRYARR